MTTRPESGDPAPAGRADLSRIEDLVQGLDAIVWEADPATFRFSFVSRRAEDILGYPVAKWLEESDFFPQLIHPEDRDRTLADYLASLREGTDHHFEYRVVDSHGDARWIRDRVHVRRDEDGRAAALRGVMVDVTERKGSEDALRESEERYRRLVHGSPDAIFIHSGGKIVYANESAARLLGADSPQELLGLPALQIVHPDYQDIVRERIRAEEQGRQVEMIEEKFVRLDGSVVDVEVSGIPFTYQGQPAGQIVVRDISRRKKTEIQLRETEERYRALVESISAVLYIEATDTGDNTLYISPQIESLLGITAAEYLGDPKAWEKHVHPDDRARVRSEYEAFINKGTPEISEYRMITEDGRTVWVQDRSKMLAGEDGEPILVQGVMLDITEQKIAEEALRRRDAILEAVDLAAERFLGTLNWEDTIDDVLRVLGTAAAVSRTYIFENETEDDGREMMRKKFEWVAPSTEPLPRDPTGQLIDYKADGFERWLESFSSDRLIHGPVSTLPDPERASLSAQGIQSILAAPVFVEHGLWGFIGFDDCEEPREWSAAEIDALRAASGTLGAAIERQRTEEQLRETESKYRALVERIPAILYVDEPGVDDTTVYISPQIESILGLSAEEWIADSTLWQRHLHPEDREKAYLTYRRGIAAGEPFSYEYRMVTPRGVVWIRDDAVVLSKEDGNPMVQGVMFDITEQKAAELALLESEGREREAADRLRELDQMKNTFLAAVSHELRSPLTSVLGLALTLEHQDLSDEEHSELLQRLAANARKLERLLADLLDIDRLSRGVITPQVHTTDVGALVRRTVQESDYLRGRTVRVEADSLVAAVDSPKVERIVENLLVNAVRHTDETTTVWVKATDEEGGILIVVEDDGPGIPEELREAIFEPFRQGPARSSHSPGTGIGLTLVSRFAQLHGGRAWVEDRPGGGSSFRVFLPAAASPGELERRSNR